MHRADLQIAMFGFKLPTFRALCQGQDIDNSRYLSVKGLVQSCQIGKFLRINWRALNSSGIIWQFHAIWICKRGQTIGFQIPNPLKKSSRNLQLGEVQPDLRWNRWCSSPYLVIEPNNQWRPSLVEGSQLVNPSKKVRIENWFCSKMIKLATTNWNSGKQ